MLTSQYPSRLLKSFDQWCHLVLRLVLSPSQLHSFHSLSNYLISKDKAKGANTRVPLHIISFFLLLLLFCLSGLFLFFITPDENHNIHDTYDSTNPNNNNNNIVPAYEPVPQPQQVNVDPPRSSLYSSAFCIDDGGNRLNQFRNRVCRFQNLCYKPHYTLTNNDHDNNNNNNNFDPKLGLGTWLYYRSPSEKSLPLPLIDFGKFFTVLPEGLPFITLRPSSSNNKINAEKILEGSEENEMAQFDPYDAQNFIKPATSYKNLNNLFTSQNKKKIEKEKENDEGGVYMRPVIIEGSIENKNNFVPRNNKNNNQNDFFSDLFVLIHPFAPSSFHSIILYDLFPLFNLINSFGMKTNNIQILTTMSCTGLYPSDSLRASRCVDNLNSLLSGVSNKVAISLDNENLHINLNMIGPDKPEMYCFENILMGVGPWSSSLSLSVPLSTSWYDFRNYYVSNLLINSMLNDDWRRNSKFLFSLALDSELIDNFDEFSSALTNTFGSLANFISISLNKYTDYLPSSTPQTQWKNHIKNLMDTDVLITTSDQISPSLLFLNRPSVIILIDYLHNQHDQGLLNDFGHRFITNSLSWVKVYKIFIAPPHTTGASSRVNENIDQDQSLGATQDNPISYSIDLDIFLSVANSALNHIHSFREEKPNRYQMQIH